MRRALAWLPAVAALVVLLGAGAAGLGLRYERGTRFPAGSTHRSDGQGLRALYLLLAETGHRPRRHTRAEPPPGALLVMAEPTTLQPRERDDAILQWVSHGGELLVALPRVAPPPGNPSPNETASARDRKGTTPEPPRPSLAERLGFRATGAEVWGGPMPGSPFEKLVAEKELARQHFSHWPRDARLLLGGPEAPILMEVRQGQGRVLALADPGFLDNEGLAGGDRLPFALAVTAGRGLPVAFDEFAHGVAEQAGLAYVLGRYGLLPTALASLAFLALLAWRTSPPEAPSRPAEASFEMRDSLVEARALFYSQVLRPAEAVDLVDRDLRHNASLALGSPRLLSWEELEVRMRERKPALLGRLRALGNQTKELRRHPPARLSEVVPYATTAAHLLEEMR